MDPALRDQLLDRRGRLQTAISQSVQTESLHHLPREVDLALEKSDNGTYGLCETCHDSIERDRLMVDPLIRNCIDHLSATEQRALERDLDLAYEVQNNLLPKKQLSVQGWSTAYHYEAAGPVSGDYCDLLIPQNGDGSLYFFLGDVSGKGVAASILMAHLHAIFRSLISANLPINQLVAQANRLFCEGTMSTHFATLVCGRATRSGEVEISNAGHCLPFLIRDNKVKTLPSTGIPLGMFCAGEYPSERVTMEPGDSLFLYSDGLTEAQDRSETQYGEERAAVLLTKNNHLSPQELIRASVEDVKQFLSGARKADDLTMMVVRRVG
ncbi:MAG: SpoIIE family protein phosphatase [Ignavibacteria bacterium]|nr:SpoIIE family protein phosphatase [Ignavibacteria bacterium]